MTNGANVCPTCGCPVGPWHCGSQVGQWQGHQWAGPAWGGSPWCGPSWGPGPGWTTPGWERGYASPYAAPYAPRHVPTYYGALPTDSEIEEMIYDALDADPLIPFDANIEVTVEAGTVYLRGEVPSKRIKHAAGDDAWWIPGVVDVHNEIKVVPRRPRSSEAGQAREQE